MIEPPYTGLKGDVAFTGRLASMKRAAAFAEVVRQGGTPRPRVTKATSVLIVGELGWPLFCDGRLSNSITQAKIYRVPITSERQFLAWLGQGLPDGQTKSYTKDQLAALSKVPPELIEQLDMFGLIEPRADRYGFRDLAAARQIAALLASGVRLSVITQSLSEIRQWLPDAGLANLRLFPESSDSLLVEQLHGRTDTKGQFVLAMEKPFGDPDSLFQEAQEAEETEDHASAERLYGLVVKIDPNDCVAAFNLANVLRAQGKLIEAEAAYRSALKRAPDFAEAWYNLADLLDDQRRGHEAVRCLEKAIQADPDYTDAVFNLALLLQRLDRSKEAATQWKRYLELDRASPWAARAKRALKFCEMQMANSGFLKIGVIYPPLGAETSSCANHSDCS
jgi:tetratricopeptide (TPR) repeat protein